MLTYEDIQKLPVGTIILNETDQIGWCARVKYDEDRYVYASQAQEPWFPNRDLMVLAEDCGRHLYVYTEPDPGTDKYLAKIQSVYKDLIILHPDQNRSIKRTLTLTIC